MPDYRILGPVEVVAGGAPAPIGRPQHRLTLAALLVDAGALVPTETLVDRVWGPKPPAKVRQAAYSTVSRLRGYLADAAAAGAAPARLLRRSGGYLLDVDPEQVDAYRFARLADTPGTDVERAAALREALGLWRGEPLAGLSGEWVDRVRAAWQQRRLGAVVAWAAAELATGNAARTIDPLADLIDEHPLAEPAVAALMRALHAAGRPAEALARYAAVRERLADELGADPGAELRDLHAAILRGDLDPAPPAPAARSSSRAGPALLPVDVYGFAGRDAELARLDTVLAGAAGQPTAVPIAVLSGTAGVGKTSLAVHWAHRSRDRYPDGQLYLNLRGFDPGGPALDPAEAVRRLLDALGLPAARIPPAAGAQADLYRTELAGRRLILVLDNARDTGQVRPLLPGSPGPVVLVTSRSQLAGLVAAEGARPVPVGLLTEGGARELLARRLGADRVAAEPAAAGRLVARSARLPLALAIVAARAAVEPALPLARIDAALAEGGLDALSIEDAGTDLRAALSWSYRVLSDPAARLFRLLGLAPGPDLGEAAVASLAGRPPAEVRPLLAELTGANLLATGPAGRYGFHDLLRAAAAELARAVEPAPERAAATGRLLDHYLHSGLLASRLLDPSRDTLAVEPARPGVTVAGITDMDGAWAWYAAEHAVLLTAVPHAAGQGFDRHAWGLTWSLTGYLERRAYWAEWVSTHLVALAAAERLGDDAGQAFAHRHLAAAYTLLSDFAPAERHIDRAVRLYELAGDRVGQAYAHLDISGAHCERTGRLAEALDHAERARELFTLAGHAVGQGRALNAVGWYHALLGDPDAAVAACDEALAAQRRSGDRQGESATLDSLGYAHRAAGRHRAAAGCYEQALVILRELGDRYYEASTLSHLGECRRAAGDEPAARRAWRAALAILDEIGHADADGVRARLAGQPGRPSGTGP